MNRLGYTLLVWILLWSIMISEAYYKICYRGSLLRHLTLRSLHSRSESEWSTKNTFCAVMLAGSRCKILVPHRDNRLPAGVQTHNVNARTRTRDRPCLVAQFTLKNIAKPFNLQGQTKAEKRGLYFVKSASSIKSNLLADTELENAHNPECIVKMRRKTSTDSWKKRSNRLYGCFYWWFILC